MVTLIMEKSGILEKSNQSIFFIIPYIFNNLSNFKINSFRNMQKLWRGVQEKVPDALEPMLIIAVFPNFYRLIFGKYRLNIDQSREASG